MGCGHGRFGHAAVLRRLRGKTDGAGGDGGFCLIHKTDGPLLAGVKVRSAYIYIGHHLVVYRQQTAVVSDYYAAQGKYASVNGTGSMEEVFSRITDVIDQLQ